jgi:hypothetical protein
LPQVQQIRTPDHGILLGGPAWVVPDSSGGSRPSAGLGGSVALLGHIQSPLGTTPLRTSSGQILSTLGPASSEIVLSQPSDIRSGGSGNFGRRDFDAAVPEPAAVLLFAAGFALVVSRLGRRQA